MIGQTLVKTLFAVIIVIFILVVFIGRNETDNQQKQIIEKSNMPQTTEEKSAGSGRGERIRKVRLNNAANSLNRFKRSVEKYREREGNWPESISDAGSASNSTTGLFMQNVRIDDGEIYGFLKPEYGNKKIIRVYPTQDRSPYKWKCTTNIDLGGDTKLGGMECAEDPNISYTGSYF